MGERLQNILAAAGIASRRGSARIIEEGRVAVDGAICCEPGARFDPAAVEITVDGAKIGASEAKRTIMLYKPVGVLSSMDDPFGGRTVRDIMVEAGIKERLVPVGRLDKESEGLLLMSNDGDLAFRLTHPRFEHEKRYSVRVAGKWSLEKLEILRGSVRMEDGYMTRPASVAVIDVRRDNTAKLEFVLKEGHKRQIRQMCSAAHLIVLSLERIAIGALRLPPEMKPGEWRDLTKEEMESLVK
ncbi:MAG: rRNA pseudouridine synthase [Kiritimatiellae bacterium]|nr:rRNA pseudouridine synthase [Kiritimatiellia bacterium]